jgi:signal transduction histidine kinase/ActR/RegA family two-component response regulator
MANSFKNDSTFLLRMLEIIPKAQHLFLEVDDDKIAFEYILNEIIKLTESEYGFIAEVILDTETNLPFLRAQSITNIAWNDSILEFYNLNYAKGLEFRNLDTLFGRVLKYEEVIIANDVANDPRASGIPKGHPALNSFLGMPIKKKGKLIAMVGIANRKQGFSQELVDALDPILQSISSFFSTLQIRAKNKLENKEKISLIQNFQKFSDLVPGMFYQYLIKPDGTASFPYASKGIEKIYKITPEELIQDVSILVNIIHPEDLADVIESIIQSSNSMEPWSKEYRVIDGNAESGIRWLFGRANPEKESDGSILWHGFVTDITDQKKFELDLLQSKLDAEKANQTKTLFLANVSHEIRTPLNGILGFTDLLKETWLTYTQREFLHNIQISSETLLAIINDLIDISKIDTRQIKLTKDSVNLRKLLQNLINTLGLQAKEKDIEIHCIVDHDTPELIQTDYVRLNQVITNLLTNAIKFTESGRISISVSKNKYTLVFKITDTGIGIPKDEIQNIAEPFYQVDSSSTKKYKGTGLGLSICKSILEQMNSSLKILSDVGKGTTVSFELNIDNLNKNFNIDPNLNLKISNNLKEPKKTQIKVLIVEDNELNLIFVKRSIFKFFPLSKVFEANNGKIAVEIFQKEKLDLILMDIQMPVMDGYKATQEIRALEGNGSHVPIIALTAGAQDGDREKGLAVGMDEYLTKPIHINALQKVIHNYV